MRTVTLALAATLLVPIPLLQPAGAAVQSFDASVESFDGHLVPVTVYLANATGPAPTLLWGHGWAGSKADAAGSGAFFAEHGYNVVAMDFRGHGAARSTSEARVQDVDFEIRDVIAVIDWIAAQEWAQLDAAGDPTLGALGGSYGGGYQLLTAAFDDRLDAIAPEITWNDLPRSLAPNGGLKSAWLDLLYWGGNARANLAPFIHEGYAYAMATNQLPDGTVPGVPDVIAQFEKSSPKNYEIDTPAFLIQGTPDTLFNLNEALDNAAQIAATGAEVKLMTHLSGHIINTQGTVPGGLPATGIQPGAGPSPCGNVREKILAWYDHTLKGADDVLPDVALALDDGTCVVADGLAPARVLAAEAPDVTLASSPFPALYAEVATAALTSSGSVRTLVVAQDDTIVAGVPRLRASYNVIGSGATIYAALVVNDTILSSQVTPIRVDAGQGEIDLELGGIGTRLDAGERIALSLSIWNGQFAHNSERAPFVAFLSDVEVDLPVVE